MHEENGHASYEFDVFRIDAVRRTLLRSGEPVRLTAKAFDTLLVLVGHHGLTITKSELMNAVWADSAVEENNLTQQISALRKALGEKPNDHRFIVTVPGRGYCFVAPVDHVADLTNSINRTPRFDPSAFRGYGVAVCYIALVCLSFVWSAIQNRDPLRPQSLAVLNFKASERGDEFMGVAISETLRGRLGSVEDLTVRPAPADADALTAGRRLKVDTVVTGSIQRDRDRIRVAVEMIDVADGRIIWGKTFDDAVSNIFALQDAIVTDVALALNVDLSSRKVDDRILAFFFAKAIARPARYYSV